MVRHNRRQQVVKNDARYILASGTKTCWKLDTPVSYEADGVTQFRFVGSFGGAYAGIPTAVEFECDFRIAAVGVEKTGDGEDDDAEYPHFTNCPSECSDEWIEGELALEVGTLIISTSFFDRWNLMALGSFADAVAAALGAPSSGGSVDSLFFDYRATRPTQPTFSVSLRGSGDNGGVVYRAGHFELRAP
jgi:hypothetical protein